LLSNTNIDPTLNIAPLTVIHVYDLERLLPYLQKGIFTFEQAVNSSIYHDPQRLESFSNYLFHFLDQFPNLKDTEMESRFEAVIDRIRLLFPNEESQ
jgi:hypothetical protein